MKTLFNKKIINKSTPFCTSAVIALMLTLSACNSNNTEDFQAEGLKLMEEGNPNGAIVFFKNALENDANNFELRLNLAKAYIESGKNTQAEEELKKCLLQQPNNIDLLMSTANFYSNTLQPEKALEYLAQIENLQQPDANTRELVATNLRYLDRISEAEQAYKEALKLEPSRISSQINLASLYLSQARIDDGLEIINSILSKDPENTNALQLRALVSEDTGNYAIAEADYRKLISLHPDQASVAYSLGALLIRQGKIEEAEEVHSIMQRSFTSNSYEYLLAGMIAFDYGDYANARNLFQQSVQRGPTVDGLYYLSSAMHRTNSSESALSNLRRILDVQPTHSSSLMLTAQILFEQGRLQEAEYEAKRLVEFHPNNPQGFNLLANIQSALGEYDEALLSLDKALQINSSDTQAIVVRSNILLEQNKDSLALQELENAMEANAESISVRTALFNYYLENKNYNKAIEIVEEGMKELPENALFPTMLASVYMAQQKNAEAIKALQKAVNLEPTFAPATELLLNIYMINNDNQKALELCEQYLKHDPENLSFLVTSAVLLDNLERFDEATAILEQANTLNSERALISLVRRALNNNDTAKAEKYLTDKVTMQPNPQTRSLLSAFYMEQGNLQKALDVFNIEELSNSSEGLVGKYRLYSQANQLDKAIEESDKYIKAYPQSADGYVLKAFVVEQQGNFDEAFAILENAYTQIQTQELLIQLANICLRNGRNDKALSYFRTALLQEPKNVAALSGQAYAYLQQNNHKEAIENFEAILEFQPQNLLNINNLAMALAQEGLNTSRAVELATQVYIDAPENISVIDTYAFTLLANSQVDESIVVLENGLSANPNSAILNYRYGIALLEDKRKEDAVIALEKAVSIGGFPELENAKALIADNK